MNYQAIRISSSSGWLQEVENGVVPEQRCDAYVALSDATLKVRVWLLISVFCKSAKHELK